MEGKVRYKRQYVKLAVSETLVNKYSTQCAVVPSHLNSTRVYIQIYFCTIEVH
jgi:hypothetical protein